MNVYKNVVQLIGNTPLMELSGYEKKHGISATLLAKLESFNPAGSVKDRVGYALIMDAVNRGVLRKNSVIIEPTSGNTGIGLAMAARSMGYRTILTMPETMSKERRDLLAAYGAELVLTDGAKGMQGAIEMAERLRDEIPDSFIPGQFENPANPGIHFKTTGPEIYRDTDGKVDIFVATVGTGGTLSGVGEYLKSQNPEILVVAVEPAKSPVLSQGRSGAHGIQGIGAGFVPKTLDIGIYDEVIAVEDEEAYEQGREVAQTEGILVGISSGAALAAAKRVALREENRGKIIVVLFPDGGEKYLSTPDYLIK